MDNIIILGIFKKRKLITYHIFYNFVNYKFNVL